VWLDGADSSTITGSVTTITDKANGVVFTVTTSVKKTTIGSNGSLSFLGNGYLSGSVNNLLVGTSFVLFKATAANSGYYPFFTWRDNAGQSNFPAFGYVPGGSTIAPYTTNIGAGTPSNTATIGNTYLASYSWSGTTTAVGINGAAPTSGTQSAFSSTETLMWIGYDGSNIVANVGEIILYNTVLTASQRQAVEGYLAQKWGITLPALHPFYSIPTFSRYFSPIDLPGCALWLDGADGSSVNGGSVTYGGAVTSWADKSGHSNNAANSSGSPTWNSNAIGGLPAMYMSNAPRFLGGFSPALQTSGLSVFAVAYSLQTAGLGHDQRLVSITSNNSASGADYTTTTGIMPFDVQTNNITTYYNSVQATSTALAANQNFVASMVGSGTAINAWSNGTIFTTTAVTTTSLAINSLAYGIGGDAWTSGAEPWFGYIGEIIIYNNALTTTQRQQVEGYLAQKWMIASNFLTSHPYYKIPPSTSQPVQYGDVAYGNWTRDYVPFINAMITSNAGSTPTFATYALGSYNGYASGLGGSLHPNGNIYFAPSVTTGILTFNTNTFAFSTFTPTGATLTANGWQGAALHPNGKIYFCPFGAANILMIDPVAGVGSNIAFSGATYTTNGWRGAIVAPNGTIYFIPYLATNFLSYNPTTGLFSNITGGTYAATNYYFLGAVLAPNGNIYGIPYGSSNILCVNTSTNVVTTIAPGTGSYTMVAGNYNWRGGVLGPDGYIYGIPSYSSNFLKINPITNTATNVVPTGASIAGSNGWTTGTLGPDGCIYCQPFSTGSSNVLKYNPITNVATFIPITGWVSGNTWWQCYLTSNAIFFGTNAASNVLKLTFSGIALSPSPALCYSTFYNNL